jgi:predicted ATPase
LKGSPQWRATTTQAAAKATGPSIIPPRSKQPADACVSAPCELAAEDYERLVLQGGSFFSVARYLDRAALEATAPPPDFLSHSHGEGFLRFFDERCDRQGIFIFDEPESALSPSRQILFLRLLRRMERRGQCQVIMATHFPLLMAYPGARLLLLSKYGLDPVSLEQTEHFKLTQEFCTNPTTFVDSALDEDA